MRTQRANIAISLFLFLKDLKGKNIQSEHTIYCLRLRVSVPSKTQKYIKF